MASTRARAKPRCAGARRGAEEHLAGHAYHTYTLRSPDGLVTLEFKVRACADDCRAPAAARVAM